MGDTRAPAAVVVLGAGVDVPMGLPIVDNLARSLIAFTSGEGRPVNDALREKIKNVHLNLKAVGGDAGEHLLQRLFENPGDVSVKLKRIKAKISAADQVGPIGQVIDRLCDMAEQNEAPPSLIADLARIIDRDVPSTLGGNIVDPRRIALDPIVRDAVRMTFEQVLLAGELSSSERQFVGELVAATSNLEELLASQFLRFSRTSILAEMRNYLYLAWLLWAYVKWSATNATQQGRPSICHLLSNLKVAVITFNYTNFFSRGFESAVCHFHGSIREYLRLEDRTIVANDELLNSAASIEEIANLFANHLRLEVESYPELDLPGIVPPLSFKPIMSPDQLARWASAQEGIQSASHIVIIGYSFSRADDHFNALLRRARPDARVTIVNPDLLSVTRAALGALGDSIPDDLSVDDAGQIETGRVLGVRAHAEDVETDQLRGWLGMSAA
jgi:hypothetical protein